MLEMPHSNAFNKAMGHQGACAYNRIQHSPVNHVANQQAHLCNCHCACKCAYNKAILVRSHLVKHWRLCLQSHSAFPCQSCRKSASPSLQLSLRLQMCLQQSNPCQKPSRKAQAPVLTIAFSIPLSIMSQISKPIFATVIAPANVPTTKQSLSEAIS